MPISISNEQVIGLALVYLFIVFLGWLATRHHKDNDHDAF